MAIFAAVMIAVTGVELATGRPISASIWGHPGSGTTIGNVVTANQPSGATAPQPAGTTTPSQQVSSPQAGQATPTPSPDASTSPAPSMTASAGPSLAPTLPVSATVSAPPAPAGDAVRQGAQAGQ